MVLLEDKDNTGSDWFTSSRPRFVVLSPDGTVEEIVTGFGTSSVASLEAAIDRLLAEAGSGGGGGDEASPPPPPSPPPPSPPPPSPPPAGGAEDDDAGSATSAALGRASPLLAAALAAIPALAALA